MKCYRRDCREECDDLKKMYCLYRRTKEQQELIETIRGWHYCHKCGEITVKARYKGEIIDLCTTCGVREVKIA